jgi:acyl dehydratase
MSEPASQARAGDSLPEQRYRVTRADLVRYAGASGDFNPIHWSDRVATSVGLPGVIAHGMFTMALAARALDTWAGAPGRVRELGCKFTKPVVVPDDDEGVEVVVAATVRDVDESGVHLTLTVSAGEQKVLGQSRAVLARA